MPSEPVSVTIVGLDALQRKLRASDAAMSQALDGGLKRGGLYVQAEAKRRVPVVTGKLQRSIVVGDVEGTGIAKLIRVGIGPGGALGGSGGQAYYGRSGSGAATESNVGDPRVYGPYVEEGTRPHTIVPVNARVLAFKVGGEQVFARAVQHPGTSPHPFLVPALMQNIPAVTRQVLLQVEAVIVNMARR